jgi:hypothetical protein
MTEYRSGRRITGLLEVQTPEMGQPVFVVL